MIRKARSDKCMPLENFVGTYLIYSMNRTGRVLFLDLEEGGIEVY